MDIDIWIQKNKYENWMNTEENEMHLVGMNIFA